MTLAHEPLARPKLKIALIIDSKFGSKYVHDLAQWGQYHSHLEVTHLIIQNLPAPPQGKWRRLKQSLKKRGFLSVLEQVGFTLIHKLESKKLMRIKEHQDHFSRHALDEQVKSTISVTPVISPSGLVYRYSESDIQAIKALNLDVMIRCGSGILRGDILQAARFGILSFHHADNRINRGIPAGFWEVFYKQDSTGFTLQQLTEELDGGNVLYRGQFVTKFFYLYNQAELARKSHHYLKQVLNSLALTQALPETLEALPYYNPLFTRPTLSAQLRYGAYLAQTVGANLLNRFVLKKVDRWGVAFCASNWRNLVMWRGLKIPNPPNHFLADPFVVSRGNEHFCFVEDYDYLTAKGCISVYALHENNAEHLGEALVEPFHLSFPYIFAYDSKLYMCPETGKNHDIRLYECVDFPLQWKLHKVIMSDVSAADSMLFEKDGLWWLFTNMDRFGTGDHCSELSIFYADSPLSDHWTPHPQNPIMVDAMKARNGGILYDENGIYRVSQQQGLDTYGKSTSINQIIRLTKTDYIEHTIHKIEPTFFKKIKGTHHMHSNGKFTAFDFVEKVKRPV